MDFSHVNKMLSPAPLAQAFGRADVGSCAPSVVPDVPQLFTDTERAARFMPHIVRPGVFSPQELALRAGLGKAEAVSPPKPAPSPAGEDVAEMPPSSILRLQREEAARQAYLRQKYPLQAPLLDMLG